ncbi:MAG: class I SAM-dependent methyltransferase [Bryobacteraceae bacterium]|nr:class I SAM-dependent methyltransferase [Bryobacteraceae bacterium]
MLKTGLVPRLQSDTHATIAGSTRRIYDLLSGVYPLSTYFFHSKAHQAAIEMSGISSGMRVLEVATGSGEMFRRLVHANPDGVTVGLDLSPKMAARTNRQTRHEAPGVNASCGAVDARHMPFPDGSFDAVMCCYLLELLSGDDIVVTLQEVWRVLRPRGTFTLVLIGQNTEFFNRMYRLGGAVAPAFWGRQVEKRIPDLIESLDFRILDQKHVRQGFYPSRVVVARK